MHGNASKSESAVLPGGPQLAIFLRYETTHDQASHKCFGDLRKLPMLNRQVSELGGIYLPAPRNFLTAFGVL